VNPALRHQLRSLDRALLSMIDERARLLAGVETDDPGRAPAVDDMLRRHDGPFPAEGVREVFDAVDRHCAADRHSERSAGEDAR
jgi:chorismate mutase